MFKITIVLIMAGFIIMPAGACLAANSGLAAGVASCSFSDWINAQSGNQKPDENAEKIIIREQWERNLGIDIFYPYFKAKELESRVREKTSVKVFKLKGKTQFKSDEAKYIFSVKF